MRASISTIWTYIHVFNLTFERKLAFNSPFSKRSTLMLRCDERFTHAFTACGCVFMKLRWLAQTKVITLKTQLHAVNARWKRLSQLSLNFASASKKCSRTNLRCLAGSMWPACRTLPRPVLDYTPFAKKIRGKMMIKLTSSLQRRHKLSTKRKLFWVTIEKSFKEVDFFF